MTSSRQLEYTFHHLCIYDGDPRRHMWPYLKWHHGVTGYFSGDTFHIADEGHADYTFLGCGGRAFQIQLEAPPYQFGYERDWYANFGNAYNHICWVVNDARASYQQLQEAGATVIQEFQPFPTYDGFVMADPEGRWIEIMQYTHPTFRVQEFTNQPAGECGLRMVGFVEIVEELDDMADWYKAALGLTELRRAGDHHCGFVELVDNAYDPAGRSTVMVLSTARSGEERTLLAEKGPHIGAVLYEAADIGKAYEDATWAGMDAVHMPIEDRLSGMRLARLREPSGNLIYLREAAKT